MKSLEERKTNFIEKAVKVHGDKYDYSEIDYVNSATKVKIFCKKHKTWFYQKPNNHITGYSGCKLCAKERQIETNLERYGVTCTLLDEGVQEKIKKTLIENYGVDSPMKSEEIKNRVFQTNLERYGCISPFGNEVVQEKIKETFIKKYGVDHNMKSEDIRNRVFQTNLERYGHISPFGCETIQRKIDQTNLKRYGVSRPLQFPEFNKKMKETTLKRYGVECVFQNEDIRNRITKTNLKKYGYKIPSESKVIALKISSSWQNRSADDVESLSNLRKEIWSNRSPEEKSAIYDKIRENWKNKSAEEIQLVVDKINKTKHKNGSFNISQPEEDMYLELIEVFGEDDILRQYNSERYPFNCDFYIKSLDLFIELNAFWHHGGEWFDKTNKEHMEMLQFWKEKSLQNRYYLDAVDVWTNRDPLKRKYAIKNNLNYLVFWDSDLTDFYVWIESLKSQNLKKQC